LGELGLKAEKQIGPEDVDLGIEPSRQSKGGRS
jgi:hypothetical protein